MSGAECRVAVLSLHTSPIAAPGRGASGGLNVYVRELTRALHAEGVVSDILVRAGDGRPTALEGGGWLLPVPGPDRDLTQDEERDLIPDVTAATARVLRGRRYDLLASHHWMSGAIGQRLTAGMGAPLVHTAHTWAVQKNLVLAPGARPEPVWREQLEASIARSADRILVSTAGEGALLDARYGAGPRCSLVVPGVDVDTFAPDGGPRAEPPFFLVAARLERLKSIDTALAALAGLRHPSARLVVVGEDGGESGEQERLRGIARRLRIEGRVDFVGSLDRTHLARLYRLATAYVLPSYSETFGLVALEALACGTPLVTTRAAGVSTVVEDGVSALVVERDGFGRAMQRLLDDRELARRLSEGGRAVALRHTWRDTAHQWMRAADAAAREPALRG